MATGLLRPDTRVSYRIPVTGGELTVFETAGDGDGDIDCYLYDDEGNLVAPDIDYTDTCRVSVLPGRSVFLTWVLKNHGRISSRYRTIAY